MKKFIETLKSIWRVEELRNRILLTLGLIMVYRIGSYIVLPGVNMDILMQSGATKGGIMDILNLFAGGAFSRASIFALGIMPYISASIIMQLMGIAVPSIQKMQNEGESGRKKINNYTRVLTIVICALQGPSYISFALQGTPGAIANPTAFWWIATTMILISGTMFVVWMGEKITDKGIGNGISLLIAVGIMANLPAAFVQEFVTSIGAGGNGVVIFIVEIIALMVVVLVTVLLIRGVRKVPINYAKQMVGGRRMAEQSSRNYLPLKVNASGVMPIIFAQAIMTLPMYISQYSGVSFLSSLTDIKGFGYNLVFAILIIVFTYFYTAIMVNPKKIADDLKRNGGFVPGVKPGKNTADFIDNLVSKITLPGSFFLAVIAIMPAFAMIAGITQGFAMFYGGTSLLIMVGVVLDTLQQIESYLLNRHYDGLMDGGKLHGGGAAGGGQVSSVI